MMMSSGNVEEQHGTAILVSRCVVLDKYDNHKVQNCDNCDSQGLSIKG